MDVSFIVTFLAATIAAGTPILFAAAGEMIAERSGVMNLGVEGMMLVGAVSGFMVTVITGDHWWGIMAAALAGGALALIHAFITITLHGNQVVSGLALTIFGTGLSGVLGKNYVGIPLEDKFLSLPVPYLADVPVLGPILFKQDCLVYASIIMVLILHVVIYKTKWGLSLRAVGEDPAASDAAGVNVALIRFLSTILGGMLAGVAGAYLSLAYAPSWIDNMTAGRGWIAVALVIFGMWDPFKVMLGSYLFGGVEALTFRLQTVGVTIPSFFLQMLPYLMTIIVVVMAIRIKSDGSGPPKALGTFYDREER